MYRKPICDPKCPKRKAGCHATCEEYKEWREGLLEKKRMIAEAQRLERTIDEVTLKREWVRR